MKKCLLCKQNFDNNGQLQEHYLIYYNVKEGNIFYNNLFVHKKRSSHLVTLLGLINF